jgi:signal transduction histidine kinase
LLVNALKFTPAGGRVTVQTGRNGDHHAILRVSDTGIGIPADELPHVTERFFRGQRSAGVAAGSGIGMAIVSELVRAHHGHLDISSEEGMGTQVTVALPADGD